MCHSLKEVRELRVNFLPVRAPGVCFYERFNVEV